MVTYGRPALLNGVGASHCAIEASAGTGKTFTLEHLIVKLILDGTNLENILVVTFTKKATLELKARVRDKLAELVALAEDKVKPGEEAIELTPDHRTRLHEALMGFDRATIATIHGFCQQVLKDAAFEGGRLFQQEAVASDEAFDRAFTTLLRRDFATRRKELLRVALRFLGTPTALRDLLKEALKEEDCLDLPAFEDARSFLEAFPAGLARTCLKDPVAFGFPRQTTSIKNRLDLILPRLQASLDGIPEDFWLDKDFVQDDLLDKLGPFCAGDLAGDAIVLARAVRELANFKAILVAAFLPPLREELRRFKADEGLFDFDDMISQVALALKGPQGEVLVTRLRERFTIALIDEFQDTDARQWYLFSRIFLAEGQQLFLVGDPKQAIYGFRGGDLPTYVKALADLAEAQAGQLLHLDTNYRSTEGVIRAYNALFATTGGVEFFAPANLRHYPHPVGCGKKELRLTGSTGEDLPPIRVVDVPVGEARATKLQAAASLARALEDTLRDARFNAPDRPSPVLGPGDVFVLTRTLGEGRIMADALRERGIPAALYRQDGLFDGPEAAACRDLLLAVASPLDPCRRAKALLGPFFGLNLAEAERARNLPEGHPILARLFGWRDLAEQGRFGELFSRLVSDSGLTQRLLFLDDSQRTLTNLLHILELLQQQALGGHCSLTDLAVQVQRWIDRVDRPAAEEGETQRLEREGGAVQVLTMHKAKGLQKPIVILFGGLSQGSTKANLRRYHRGSERRAWLGSAKAATTAVQELLEAEDREEGERLAYVALTRAEAQLILPCYVPGEKAPAGASSFEASGDPKAGLYRNVNRRLKTLLDLAPDAPAPEGFQRLKAEGAAKGTRDPNPGPWPLELPEPVEGFDFQALRKLARPTWLFSYSSLQKGLKVGREGGLPLEEVKEFTSADGPRGGKKLGTKVHAVLQRVDPASFRGLEPDAWLALPATRKLAEAWLPEESRTTALRWVHHAMTVPYPLPDGGTVVLSEAEEMLRELDFLTPHGTGTDFLHGSMDVLFQAQGRTFVLDWKTNRLGGYGPEALDAAVKEHYGLQVRIYTLTACRFLEIRDEAHYERAFGGAVYVFLRGLPEGGIWTCRPTWTELQAWEAEIAALRTELMIPVPAGGAPRER